MTDDCKAKVLAYVAERRLSYAVIAELCNTTRNAVAGLVFRDRHPKSTRVNSPGGRSSNMAGRGYQPATYRPEKTAANTR